MMGKQESLLGLRGESLGSSEAQAQLTYKAPLLNKSVVDFVLHREDKGEVFLKLGHSCGAFEATTEK
jgi:hypothetical protein